MRSILSERNIVIALFVLVFITFSLAHENSKELEKQYLNTKGVSTVSSTTERPLVKTETPPSKQDYIFVLPSTYRLQ
jgi:hypothetical protein